MKLIDSFILIWLKVQTIVTWEKNVEVTFLSSHIKTLGHMANYTVYLGKEYLVLTLSLIASLLSPYFKRNF